jgi:DUF4097 and DUF4098 domain-containing protein YvlB
MNKEQYFEELNNKLAKYSTTFKNSVLTDLEDHVSTGLLNGDSEEDIIERLGSVEELITVIEQEYNELEKDNEYGAQFYRDGKLNDIIYDYEHQNILEIVGSVGDIEIVGGESLNIDIDEVAYELSYTENKVRIIGNKDLNFFSRIISTTNNNVKVTIPESIDTVKVKLSLGDLNIKEVRLNEANLESSLGDVVLKKSIIDKLTIKNSAGDVKLRGTYNYAKINTSIGYVNIKNKGDINANINTSMGDVTVKIDNNFKGFKLRSNTSMGTVKIRYNKLNIKQSKKLEYITGEGLSDLVISTSAGNITIK